MGVEGGLPPFIGTCKFKSANIYESSTGEIDISIHNRKMEFDPLMLFSAIKAKDIGKVKWLDAHAHLDALTSSELVCAYELALQLQSYTILLWLCEEFQCVRYYVREQKLISANSTSELDSAEHGWLCPIM
jgi:hypothetical protein